MTDSRAAETGSPAPAAPSFLRNLGLIDVSEHGAALHVAAALGDTARVQQLLEAGAVVDARASGAVGCTPMHLAALLGHNAVVQMLLDARAAVDAADANGMTPLHEAAVGGHLSVVQLLLASHAAIDAADAWGVTPLHLAAGFDISNIQGLKANCAAPDAGAANNQNALDPAAFAGHTAIVKLLLDAKAPVNVVDVRGLTALHMPAMMGHTAIVKMLLDAHAAVDATALGKTALHAAAHEDHTDIVRVLLDAKAAVNAVNEHGETALHLAAFQGHTEVMQLLIHAKAAVNTKETAGFTALHFAADQGKAAAVRVLLDAKAAVDATDGHGNTALHWAGYKGHAAVAQLLLDAGADINAVNGERSTPIILAARSGHTQAVQQLLAAPQLTVAYMTGAARAAATAGHAELAIVVLRAVMARDMPAAAQLLGEQALGTQVLRMWLAAEADVREQQARWPALQQLLIGIAATHRQLRGATSDIYDGTQGLAAAPAATAATGEPAVLPAAAEEVVAATPGRGLKRTAQPAVGYAEPTAGAMALDPESHERPLKRPA